MKKRSTPIVDTFWIYSFLIDRRGFGRVVESITKAIKDELKLRKEVKIDIVLTDDFHITRLNKEFLNIDSPTNVLSFPENDKESGSIVISLESVFRECFLYNQSMEEHLIRLSVHGILHILGINHSTYMFDLTEKFVKKFSSTLYKSI